MTNPITITITVSVYYGNLYPPSHATLSHPLHLLLVIPQPFNTPLPLTFPHQCVLAYQHLIQLIHSEHIIK